MAKKEIIIDIADNTAEITIETKGYTGKDCVKETEFLDDLLGKRLSRALTPAYYSETVKKHLPLCG